MHTRAPNPPPPQETNDKMSFSGGGNPRYALDKPPDIEIQQPEEQSNHNMRCSKAP